jgi:hypothetical protein
MIQYGSGNFEVILREKESSEHFQIIMTGQINFTSENVATHQVHKFFDRKNSSITKSQFYDVYKHAGFHLGEEFTLVGELYRGNNSTGAVQQKCSFDS